ncbi:hypothetical protein G4B88_026368 [Cannabis sativa]|uniref:Uncharacterized protein n=1 Tax=Cannabis sativa TaxID=3483 RepID=A0A7J6E3M7_CANSA|nr:hypothetical protein G4B88_026368 [Cannabis sativa]
MKEKYTVADRHIAVGDVHDDLETPSAPLSRNPNPETPFAPLSHISHSFPLVAQPFSDHPHPNPTKTLLFQPAFRYGAVHGVTEDPSSKAKS